MEKYYIKNTYESMIYNPRLFVLTKNKSDIVIVNDEYIPIFYEKHLAEEYINNISEKVGDSQITAELITIDKIKLLKIADKNPIIYTVLDRRGIKTMTYYSKFYIQHFLLEHENLQTKGIQVSSL